MNLTIDECRPGRERGHDCHRDELDPDLAEIALDGTRDSTDRRHRQDARRHRSEHPAHAVDREYVERVVDAQPLAEQRRAVADAASRQGRSAPLRPP